ncbi:MAG: hypothetical protein IJU44_11040 [Kiritimatiellae bacterium]|nr:hypothetical protein [Kiritimatiellia bacterium]
MMNEHVGQNVGPDFAARHAGGAGRVCLRAPFIVDRPSGHATCKTARKWGVIASIAAGVAIMGTAPAFGGPSAGEDVLHRFYAANDGRALRRLPSWLVPENAFAYIGRDQISDHENTVQRRFFTLFRERSDWNLLTYCARFAEHDDPKVMERVAEAAAAMKDAGIELLMENDPRLMRDEFFKRFPEDYLRIRQYAVVEPSADGTARFTIAEDAMSDYGETAKPYSFWRPGRIVSAWAVKGSAMRKIDVLDAKCTERTVSGKVCGLAQDERLLAEAEWPLLEIDPCSPNLIAFSREVMLRYRKLGVAGLMRDEYGFKKPRASMVAHTAFWYSPNFAAVYAKRSGGRKLEDDLPLLGLGVDTPRARAAATDYTMSIYDACRRTEEDFYAANKEYFGKDAYVAKHVTWCTAIQKLEFLSNGLVWWAARRDWAQSDENNLVPASTGMMKKFGTPLWLNEHYGPEPTQYVQLLWRYAACGGRIVYHALFSWNPESSHVARYGDEKERAYHCHADLLGTDAMRAEEISRLLPLMTRAPIDCPVAQVFGHERLVNWFDEGHEDWGEPIAHGLGKLGYYVDAYPASELAGNTLAVDGDGFVRVGRQRYLACVLYHLSDRERQMWDVMVKTRTLKTRVFADPPSSGTIAEFLDAQGAVKQTPLQSCGKRTQQHLPPPDGTIRLTDGTAVRIKGASPNLAGDPISGTVESNGIGVEYSARGLFAARCERGALVAVAGGEVKRVAVPGFSLTLDAPADFALVKMDGKWHGVWQTDRPDAPVPPTLMRITPHWIRLKGISAAPTPLDGASIKQERSTR